jgi:hypothetical protein
MSFLSLAYKDAKIRATKKESVNSALSCRPPTRVFWLDKSSGLWRAGRVDGPPAAGEALGRADHYPIRFPNHDDRHICVSDLYVRWSHPISDPAEFLAARFPTLRFSLMGGRPSSVISCASGAVTRD